MRVKTTQLPGLRGKEKRGKERRKNYIKYLKVVIFYSVCVFIRKNRS